MPAPPQNRARSRKVLRKSASSSRASRRSRHSRRRRAGKSSSSSSSRSGSYSESSSDGLTHCSESESYSSRSTRRSSRQRRKQRPPASTAHVRSGSPLAKPQAANSITSIYEDRMALRKKVRPPASAAARVRSRSPVARPQVANSSTNASASSTARVRSRSHVSISQLANPSMSASMKCSRSEEFSSMLSIVDDSLCIDSDAIAKWEEKHRLAVKLTQHAKNALGHYVLKTAETIDSFDSLTTEIPGLESLTQLEVGMHTKHHGRFREMHPGISHDFRRIRVLAKGPRKKIREQSGALALLLAIAIEDPAYIPGDEAMDEQLGHSESYFSALLHVAQQRLQSRSTLEASSAQARERRDDQDQAHGNLNQRAHEMPASQQTEEKLKKLRAKLEATQDRHRAENRIREEHERPRRRDHDTNEKWEREEQEWRRDGRQRRDTESKRSEERQKRTSSKLDADEERYPEHNKCHRKLEVVSHPGRRRGSSSDQFGRKDGNPDVKLETLDDRDRCRTYERPSGRKQDSRRCPGGCGFQITWHETHCCGNCSQGKDHGKKCERLPFIEVPPPPPPVRRLPPRPGSACSSGYQDSRRCPGGCGFQITWHETHCCGNCSQGKDHGKKCERLPFIEAGDNRKEKPATRALAITAPRENDSSSSGGGGKSIAGDSSREEDRGGTGVEERPERGTARAERRPVEVKLEPSQGRRNQYRSREMKEWLPQGEAEEFLMTLCGEWHDGRRNKYTVSVGKRDSLDLETQRPDGNLQKTRNLINIEWKSGWGRVVWKSVVSKSVYKLSNYTEKTLEWQLLGSSRFGLTTNFQWTREDVSEEKRIHSSDKSNTPYTFAGFLEFIGGDEKLAKKMWNESKAAGDDTEEKRIHSSDKSKTPYIFAGFLDFTQGDEKLAKKMWNESEVVQDASLGKSPPEEKRIHFSDKSRTPYTFAGFLGFVKGDKKLAWKMWSESKVAEDASQQKRFHSDRSASSEEKRIHFSDKSRTPYTFAGFLDFAKGDRKLAGKIWSESKVAEDASATKRFHSSGKNESSDEKRIHVSDKSGKPYTFAGFLDFAKGDKRLATKMWSESKVAQDASEESNVHSSDKNASSDEKRIHFSDKSRTPYTFAGFFDYVKDDKLAKKMWNESKVAQDASTGKRARSSDNSASSDEKRVHFSDKSGTPYTFAGFLEFAKGDESLAKKMWNESNVAQDSSEEKGFHSSDKSASEEKRIHSEDKEMTPYTFAGFLEFVKGDEELAKKLWSESKVAEDFPADKIDHSSGKNVCQEKRIHSEDETKTPYTFAGFLDFANGHERKAKKLWNESKVAEEDEEAPRKRTKIGHDHTSEKQHVKDEMVDEALFEEVKIEQEEAGESNEHKAAQASEDVNEMQNGSDHSPSNPFFPELGLLKPVVLLTTSDAHESTNDLGPFESVGRRIVQGDEVIVHSLQSSPELNGEKATCVELQETGRWSITFENGDRKNIKPENIERMDKECVLKVGSRARIHSLMNGKEHNGKSVICGDFNPETGRWATTLDDGQQLGVKPEKLIAMPSLKFEPDNSSSACASTRQMDSAKLDDVSNVENLEGADRNDAKPEDPGNNENLGGADRRYAEPDNLGNVDSQKGAVRNDAKPNNAGHVEHIEGADRNDTEPDNLANAESQVGLERNDAEPDDFGNDENLEDVSSKILGHSGRDNSMASPSSGQQNEVDMDASEEKRVHFSDTSKTPYTFVDFLEFTGDEEMAKKMWNESKVQEDESMKELVDVKIDEDDEIAEGLDENVKTEAADEDIGDARSRIADSLDMAVSSGCLDKYLSDIGDLRSRIADSLDMAVRSGWLEKLLRFEDSKLKVKIEAPEESRPRRSRLHSSESRRCPGGCGFQITWHQTHCCRACSEKAGHHGKKCDRLPFVEEATCAYDQLVRTPSPERVLTHDLAESRPSRRRLYPEIGTWRVDDVEFRIRLDNENQLVIIDGQFGEADLQRKDEWLETWHIIDEIDACFRFKLIDAERMLMQGSIEENKWGDEVIAMRHRNMRIPRGSRLTCNDFEEVLKRARGSVRDALLRSPWRDVTE